MEEKKESPHKQWATGKKASMHRRCEEHGYQGRSIYMITMAVEGRLPLLGTLCGDPAVEEGRGAPHVELSPLGERVRACWFDIPRYYPEVEVMRLCVMPDHIHGVLFVHKQMEQHLGKIINGFKIGTRKAARELGLLPAGASTPAAALPQPTGPRTAGPPAPGTPAAKEPAPHGEVRYAAAVPQPWREQKPPRQPYNRDHGQLWEPGYHDRILLRKGQLDRMLTYLMDNPRRLLLKRRHPEFFTNLGTIEVAGIAMQAMGNRLLLDNPMKLQVQCSRSLTQEEIDRQQTAFVHEGLNGTVLISPCISPGESQIATAALQQGIALIVLLLKGFHPHFKPAPRYLQACTEGRLLMLAPYPWQNEKIVNMRQRCLHLNAIAKMIAEH